MTAALVFTPLPLGEGPGVRGGVEACPGRCADAPMRASFPHPNPSPQRERGSIAATPLVSVKPNPRILVGTRTPTLTVMGGYETGGASVPANHSTTSDAEADQTRLRRPMWRRASSRNRARNGWPMR